MAFKGKKQPIAHENANQSEFIRRFKTNPFVFGGTIIVLIIVIVAFVFVPAIVPEAGRGGADLTFGAYDKIPINYVPGNYFSRMQEMYTRYRQSSINDSNYMDILRQVWQGAFEETVVHTGILDAMKRAGYTPPSNVVDKEVALRPEFQENGRFSSARYRQYDNTARMAIWREVQDSLIERRYRSDIGGLLVSSKEGDFIASMASPERSYDMVAFPLSQYPDAEVIAYVEANPDTFRVTHLYKITINSSEREARQVLASIQEGVLSFEEAAVTHSKDYYAEKGGDMGLKMGYELVSEVPDAAERAAVAALSAGEYSSVVKVPSGWAFFRCGETSYPPVTTETDTLIKLRRYMEVFERGRVEDWMIGRAEAFIALVKESSFEEAVASQELSKQSFGPVPLNFGGSDLFTSLRSYSVPELSYADYNENFWKTAFFTPVESPSIPLVLGSNILVLYPWEERPAPEEKIDSVQTSVSSYWLSYNTELSIRSFFLTSPKLENRFENTFQRLFGAAQAQ